MVEKVRIPIVDPTVITPATGAYHPKGAGADLYNEPDASGRVFARLPAGQAASAVGTATDYVKLALGGGRFAFARTADVTSGGTPSAQVAFEDAMAHAPPALEIPQPQLATRDPHTSVSVAASDDARLLDAYIFVGARKAFYRSNRNGADRQEDVVQCRHSASLRG